MERHSPPPQQWRKQTVAQKEEWLRQNGSPLQKKIFSVQKNLFPNNEREWDAKAGTHTIAAIKSNPKIVEGENGNITKSDENKNTSFSDDSPFEIDTKKTDKGEAVFKETLAALDSNESEDETYTPDWEKEIKKTEQDIQNAKLRLKYPNVLYEEESSTQQKLLIQKNKFTLSSPYSSFTPFASPQKKIILENNITNLYKRLSLLKKHIDPDKPDDTGIEDRYLESR